MGVYEGFTYGRIYIGTLTRSSTPLKGIEQWISPTYDVTNRAGHTIVYNYHEPGMLPKDFWGTDYGEESVYATLSDSSHWASNGDNGYMGSRCSTVENTLILPSNISTLIVATASDLDDFYIYDKTVNEYIFHGNNIVVEYRNAQQLLQRRRLLMNKSEPYYYEGFYWGHIYQWATWVKTQWVSVRNQSGASAYKNQYITPLLPVEVNHTYIYPYANPPQTPRDYWSSDYAEASCCVFTASATSQTDSSAQIKTYGGRISTYPVSIKITDTNAAYAVFAGTVPIDDFYVYDKTAEEYIFRGLNVTPEYMVNSDAYRFVFDLPEEKTLKLFNNGTPSKVVIDGVNTTVATTYTLSEGKHVVYAWLNPWAYANAYIGQPDGTSSTYLTEYRTPTWANTDVTTNAHYLYWLGTAPNLTEIISLCETPPNFGPGTNANKGLRASTLKTIKVPNNVVNLYKTTAPWNASAIVNKIVGTDFILD